MFERFTQKAIDVVQSAQNLADSFGHKKVMSQHLLMGLYIQTKGVQAKILNFDKINYEDLQELVINYGKEDLREKENNNILFSRVARDILKLAVELSVKLNSKFVMPQHIALALFLDKNTVAYEILEHFNVDKEKIIANLEKMLDKSTAIQIIHPEIAKENNELSDINKFFKEKVISNILSNAQSKLTASEYEIVGTEQILQSILENKDYKIVEILNKYSIDFETFNEELKKFSSRYPEFENSEKQIIFTPNAFRTILVALDCAKEMGSTEILAEHIVLGILKLKKGIAYKILSSLLPNAIDFEDIVVKKLNENIPETLAIMRLAKQEARALMSNTIGTEMILLAILSYGTGIAYRTLKRLGINYKDAKFEIEKIIKTQNIKEDENPNYSPRAKQVLEIAYHTASEHKKNKIKSENILYGITKVENCVAMQILSALGTDILEIKEGIKQELLGGMEL